MKLFRFLFLITIFFCCWPDGLVGQGFRISLDVSDLPEQKVILSHRFGLKFYTDDTVKTDTQGKAVFEGADLKPEGMYQLVFPDKKFAEFFLDKNQIFSISTRASAPMESLSFSGSPENHRFLEWQQKYSFYRSRSSLIQNRLKKGNLTPDSANLLKSEIQQIQRLNNNLWDSAIHDLTGTLPGLFIKGLKPVKVPESLEKSNTADGQVRQYQFIRTHFFGNVDFTDERLLRTPLIENKLDQYFKQMVPQVPDTIIQEAGQIIERSKPAKKMYQFVVQYLFNLYSDPEIMGTDAVYVYIADNYYLNGQAPWVDSANLQGIRVRVKELKPLLIGKVPPALESLVNTIDQPVEIKDIKSKYLIIYFWSPDCGFCKESTPKLHNQYSDLKKMGIEVVAVNTRLDKDLWVKFITDNQLSWINVYSPLKVREMIDNYQAFTTPALFILDSDRRIIARNISVDQVKSFLEKYLASH